MFGGKLVMSSQGSKVGSMRSTKTPQNAVGTPSTPKSTNSSEKKDNGKDSKCFT
jgi:hypothetical protein